MAIVPGARSSEISRGYPSAGLHTLWDLGRPTFYAPTSNVASINAQVGVITFAQPSPEAFATVDAVQAGAFSFDFYYRIYLQPSRIEFGNLVTPTTRTVNVWNAYPSSVTINQLDGDTEGLDLGFMPPTVMRGLAYVTYDVTATLDGPSFVDTLLTLHFSLGGTRDLAVSYGRVLVLAILHEWGNGFLERLEWLTDVSIARDGSEQRVALRAQPRRSFEFDVLEYGNRGALDLLLNAWQSRVYAVPVWTDKSHLSSTLSAGATSIAISTTDLDYHTGGLVVVGNTAGATEALEILALTANTLTLKRPVIGNWPAGSWIAPARLARLPASQTVNRPTAAMSQAKLRFELDDLVLPVTATSSAVQYGGYDTLLRYPNRVEDVTVEYQRITDVLDYQTGSPIVTDAPNRPFIVRQYEFLLVDRSDITAMRRWLLARAGRQVPVWVPTWERGVEIAAAFASDATEILVESRGFSTYYTAMPGREDIAFLHNDGSWTLRQITAFEYVDGVVERMRLNASLGRAGSAADFKIVCFLELARLESDAIEIFFETDQIARVSVPLRSISA